MIENFYALENDCINSLAKSSSICRFCSFRCVCESEYTLILIDFVFFVSIWWSLSRSNDNLNKSSIRNTCLYLFIKLLTLELSVFNSVDFEAVKSFVLNTCKMIIVFDFILHVELDSSSSSLMTLIIHLVWFHNAYQLIIECAVCVYHSWSSYKKCVNWCSNYTFEVNLDQVSRCTTN
jgi:hypothetical protein